MTDKYSTPDIQESSQGHPGSTGAWLDTHFEASRPEYEAMLQSVGIESGWRVLDAGCGGGSFLPLMTELVGPTGHINALDLAPENIAMVNERLAKGDLSGLVETEIGSVTSLRYQDNIFDAVWSANVSQYLNNEELATMIAEFYRVTRPGGLVAIKEFDASLTRFYPSDPALLWRVIEASHLNQPPIHGCLRTVGLPSWFEQAGLIEVRQYTTLTERRQPLRLIERQQIGGFFTFMATLAEQSGVAQTDMIVWRNLQDLSTPDHIMNQPDFYFREGHMVVVGRVPKV
jgi:ubiquinone/menaquinone biosynthesis C-methylase UbiE